ncbi:MAG TPA: type IIL restriction-modification enzyme MmeI [Methyloceanibacter sp.]|nr:type IIL restriction-modification enzyme MmeI [Methyloceanibacter sp.]
MEGSPAAEIVAKGKARRFGLVTTNSITQVFSRRVVAQHLEAKKPISLLMAIPDHPWTKATPEAAAVRIAMTVGEAGKRNGILLEVEREAGLDTDRPEIDFSEQVGRINADLTTGTDLALTYALKANDGLCSRGMSLHGSGFIVRPEEAEHLGLGQRKGLEQHIRPYRNGRDLMARPRGVVVIDLFGLDAEDVRKRFPEVYQHVLQAVKPGREVNNRASYKDNWWIFGEPRRELRPALAKVPRYIATVETASHRVFQFLDAEILPDNMLVCVALQDAFDLGILSSRIHVTWALRAGGWLGIGNDPRYSKSRCFDPFPFPECSEELPEKIRAVAEELDAHRKARQAEHPKLTLTQMYNVLEKLKAGEVLNEAEELIKDDGLVLILKELHQKLDRLVFEAYGWPEDLTDEQILERLVALNKKRAAEEKRGQVRWLRPDYQIPRFGSDAEKARLKAEKDEARAAQEAMFPEIEPEAGKPRFPTEDELAETAAVMSVLATAAGPISIDDIATSFSQGRQIRKRVAMTILALMRLGHLASSDKGETFSLRRTA